MCALVLPDASVDAEFTHITSRLSAPLVIL
jgi:hypothetical protein